MIIAEFKIQSIEELISKFWDKYKKNSYSALEIFLEIILDSIAARRSFDLEDSSWPVELVQLFAKTCIARQKRDMQQIIKKITKTEYNPFIDSGEVLKADNATLVAIKTVKGEKFALNNMQQGEFLGYLAGKFTINGDSYSEHIEKGTSNEHQGKVFTFKGWLETKQEHGVEVIYWHHKGLVNGTEETEVWRKLAR